MHSIIIPIQVNSLFLEEGKTMMNALADFSKQPWSDGERDYNAESPYLGQFVLEEAFQSDTSYMPKGLYLHWILPKALRESSPEDNKFPAVPNRWLVNKLDKNQRVIRQWIVESDFISSSLNDDNKHAINVAIELSHQSNRQPFKYIGRQILLQDWKEESKEESSWKTEFKTPLTALGYGEPSFSTLFPNCRSVFGFYDAEATENDSYEVMGFYNDPEDDLFHSNNEEHSIQNQLNKHEWTLNGTNKNISQSLFYSKINSDQLKQEVKNPEKMEVSVGHSPTEALSACLAKAIANKYKDKSLEIEKVEKQLESILLKDKRNSKIDEGPNFMKAVHREKFQTEEGGMLWSLRETAKEALKPPSLLSDDIALKLNTLNLAQKKYDEGVDQLDKKLFQLYSDWCKYIEASYPPLGEDHLYPNSNRIKTFIENDIRIINDFKSQVGELKIDKVGNNYEITVTKPRSLASSVKTSFDGLKESLLKHPEWELNIVAGSRYYRPKDPVVLFSGKDQHFDYLNSDVSEKLPCLSRHIDFQHYISNTSQKSVKELLSISDEEIKRFLNKPLWQPQLLQWMIGYHPQKVDKKLVSSLNNFGEEDITSRYTLKENKFDFSIKQDSNANGHGYLYEGSTYLSGSVKQHFITALKQFISQKIEIDDGEDFDNYLIKWIGENKESNISVLYVACCAYVELKECFVIAQSVGGFHDALLQVKHALQLPIKDPLGFEEYQKLTQDVSSMLEGKNFPAPTPCEVFTPIRAGSFQLEELTFRDQFGKKLTIATNEVTVAQSFKTTVGDSFINLYPRFSQASRLNLSWLSANYAEVEVNSHLNTTPVCGWIVPNYLDNSIIFYTQEGVQLGSFSISGEWKAALVSNKVVNEEDLSEDNPKQINPHLLQVILYLLEGLKNQESNAFLKDFIDSLEGAQENIYPETKKGHDAMVLLMGKPIAVTRVSLNLEVKGGYQHDQSWPLMWNNLEPPFKHSTDGYENVKWAIRLGEQNQLNDGLIGYWRESDNKIDSTYYANGLAESKNKIEQVGNESHTLAESPMKFTVLMDPHGILHATTGMLPVKTIRINHEHFAAALKNMEFHFFTAPILSPSDTIEIAIPSEEGYQWEWISEKEKPYKGKVIQAFEAKAEFKRKMTIQEGWLKLTQKK